ncbi:two pore channel protein 1-like isoform X2 [Dreissena polymorpha]|uniref:two pore channel protein 1-like isoform X2 n=1 Tax=Dreissena polymorpha TaxID=45954 RepID=UPI002263E81E|nr:two pore channel protein 1-like isoform X2 [Dreissena polymorpha]
MAEFADIGQLILDDLNTEYPEIYSLNERNPEGHAHTGTELNWKLNHLEAAIYLQEGENNDKFFTHPASHEALPGYQIAHNTWLYVLDLFASVSILLLAACERPAVDLFMLPVGVHGSLEILMLLLLPLELGIRMTWLGWRVLIRHPRTVIKTSMLLIMLVEAITVICRQTNHFRVTRALRPIFLLNTHYCRGVRRIARQTLQSLPPIIDMLVLLLFIMLIFSILGFYLFSTIPANPYFASLKDSFVSLFILLTTANYPDVMMPAYSTNQFSALFFITYLSIELYFVMNLFLAVVYDTFSGFEKEKLKNLFLHKREGCRRAFKLLVTKEDPHCIRLDSFMSLLAHFRPKLKRKEGYLMFKALNTQKNGKLSLEEFYNIYNICDLAWKPKSMVDKLWSADFCHPFNTYFEKLNKFVTWKWFEIFVYLMIFANFISMIVETIQVNMQGGPVSRNNFTISDVSIAFICIYTLEVILKVMGKGPVEYFTNPWDIFDFLVTMASLAGIIGETVADSFYYIIILRPLRLLRLFKIKKRYRDVLGTFFMLIWRLSSLVVMIILVYYFFAIIAMEMFRNSDLTNCCKNTSVEANYAHSNTSAGFYYLNNFSNIFISGVTLFELTVVNNWYVIMEGYAHGFSEWTRIYFMTFYIVMMVVMNIVVAFVLELFLFRIAYRRTMKLEDIDDHLKLSVDLPLSADELEMCENGNQELNENHIISQCNTTDIPTPFMYRGQRSRSKQDFSLRMYKEEVEEWIQEDQKERERIIQDLELLRRHSTRHQ